MALPLNRVPFAKMQKSGTVTESNFAVSFVLTAVDIMLTGVYHLLLVGGEVAARPSQYGRS
ncbi:MAG TPA: hypothetical protein VMU26_25255 [Candidatus Polarisedimenticolia bacterium]|nr:hypothetical protein [Candidatus Polarisedimenticolia bacterium]